MGALESSLLKQDDRAHLRYFFIVKGPDLFVYIHGYLIILFAERKTKTLCIFKYFSNLVIITVLKYSVEHSVFSKNTFLLLISF